MRPDESIRVHIRESEGYFVASCLELAIVTQGCTLDETVSNVKEAVCLFLEDEDPEYIGVVPNPRILLTMEVETASAKT
jgi:predicted RNase H-like HicB family nuclease